jgi:hypothetical protein
LKIKGKEIKIKAKYIKVGIFVILLLITILMLVVAFVNYFDIKTDFLNLNPPDKLNEKNIFLSYPSYAPARLIQYNSPKQDNFPEILFNLTLQYRGVLTERTKVNVSAIGIIDTDHASPFNDNPIAFVIIGFDHANPPEGEILMLNPLIVEPFDNYSELKQKPLIVDNLLSRSHNLTEGTYANTIFWEDQGDYTPYITITYRNKTSKIVEYPNQKVHVVSPDIINQEKNSRVNTLISIVLLIFSTITMLQLIVELFPETYLNQVVYDDEKTEGKKKTSTKSNENAKRQK